MSTKSIPLDLKALRAEACKPEPLVNDPNVFTTAQYATDNGVSLRVAQLDLKALAEAGRIEPTHKLILRRGDRKPRSSPAWRLVKGQRPRA